MNQNLLRDEILGSRTKESIGIFLVLFFAGVGFVLAGLSSYFGRNFLQISQTKQIVFIPQGITMLFYGSAALGLSFYLFFTIFWNVGSGYNEFSKTEQVVRLVRLGFPGKNRQLFFSYEFQNIRNLKFKFKQGLNPRSNIFLVLKDKREIPLFPAQLLLNPLNVEKKAIQLAKFIEVPLETIKN